MCVCVLVCVCVPQFRPAHSDILQTHPPTHTHPHTLCAQIEVGWALCVQHCLWYGPAPPPPRDCHTADRMQTSRVARLSQFGRPLTDAAGHPTPTPTPGASAATPTEAGAGEEGLPRALAGGDKSALVYGRLYNADLYRSNRWRAVCSAGHSDVT